MNGNAAGVCLAALGVIAFYLGQEVIGEWLVFVGLMCVAFVP